MRDLLYLSENKMRALVPQLPGQLRRRLGFEAGINAGVMSAKATLQSESQPSSVALLDAVVEMIEQGKGSRWRTDSDLRAGDWIQFEEEFRYGDAATAPYLRSDEGSGHALSGLVYFAATDAVPPFVLCGSSVHVLDRWQSPDSSDKRVGHFYMDALVAYARQLAEMPDEAATTELVPPTAPNPYRRSGYPMTSSELEDSLDYALGFLCRSAQFGDRGYDQWATEPVWLSGHARVLAVIPGREGSPGVLSTPLYVEYAYHE